MKTRNFVISVKSMAVFATEESKEIINPHALAIVDGERWNYKIKKVAGWKPKGNNWYERGMNYVHYHAKNSGLRVEFKPVGKGSNRRKKTSEKQQTLF